MSSDRAWTSTICVLSASSATACRLFIEPGSPWENGYIESFDGKLRDECLNLERFDTLLEARVLIGRWRLDDHHLRPHRSLGYRPPAPEAIETSLLGDAVARVQVFGEPGQARFVSSERAGCGHAGPEHRT